MLDFTFINFFLVSVFFHLYSSSIFRLNLVLISVHCCLFCLNIFRALSLLFLISFLIIFFFHFSQKDEKCNLHIRLPKVYFHQLGWYQPIRNNFLLGRVSVLFFLLARFICGNPKVTFMSMSSLMKHCCSLRVTKKYFVFFFFFFFFFFLY